MPPVLEYCTVDELETLGMGGRAFRDRPEPEKLAAIATATSFIDSHLRNQYTLPLQVIGPDIRRAAAIIASYYLLVSRGFDPSDEGNNVILEERDRQMRWLEGIAKGSIAPAITDSSTAKLGFGTGPRVITSGRRGFGSRSGDNKCGSWDGSFTRRC
jgi:phage gp36-like protein